MQHLFSSSFFCQFGVFFPPCWNFIDGAEFGTETTVTQPKGSGPTNAVMLIFILQSHNNFEVFFPDRIRFLLLLEVVFDYCKKESWTSPDVTELKVMWPCLRAIIKHEFTRTTVVEHNLYWELRWKDDSNSLNWIQFLQIFVSTCLAARDVTCTVSTL